MNGLSIVVLGLVGLWLALLTFVLILVIRQIALLTVRLSVNGQAFSLANDGPEVGSNVSEEILSTLPVLERKRTHVLLISATCAPCRELVTELSEHRFEPSVIALVAGREELAEGLIALLPSNFQVVRDPQATTVAQALNVKSTPFALTLEDGTVSRKAYMYRPADFVAFAEGTKGSDVPIALYTEVDHAK